MSHFFWTELRNQATFLKREMKLRSSSPARTVSKRVGNLKTINLLGQRPDRAGLIWGACPRAGRDHISSYHAGLVLIPRYKRGWLAPNLLPSCFSFGPPRRLASSPIWSKENFFFSPSQPFLSSLARSPNVSATVLYYECYDEILRLEFLSNLFLFQNDLSE